MHRMRSRLGKVGKRRLVQELELLCGCGAGLQAIASPFCAALKRLLEARSVMLMWFTEDEQPLGFFHDTAPAELKDLFISQLDTLFLNADASGLTVARPEGPLVGKMCDPELERRFRESEIYRLLCVPLGDHELIDMRAHVPGIGFAGCFVWKGEGDRFGAEHLELLTAVQPMMQHALERGAMGNQWRSVGPPDAHLITDVQGGRLIAIDDHAEALLCGSHLLRQHVSMLRQPRLAPSFAAILAQQLGAGRAGGLELPVPDGRLVCRASRTHFVRARDGRGDGGEDGAEDALFIALDLQAWDDVPRIAHLMTLELTPLQRRLALHAMNGGERARSADVFGLSEAALKQHSKMIYEALEVQSWRDLVGWMPAAAR